MKKIVYLLGAGFSRPLGLPVMSDFISKSKDIYSADESKYSYFDSVFKEMKRLNNIKNYFQSDLFNIEEVLSLFEMEEQLGGKSLSGDFKKYISDVIEYYTPDLTKLKRIFTDSNFIETNLKDSTHKLYAVFVLSLFNLIISKDVKHRPERDITRFSSIINTNPESQYEIISLNYDNVLENFLSYYCTALELSDKYSFTPPNVNVGDIFKKTPNLFKLHGSAKKENIIPPTWSKRITEELLNDWANAYFSLSEATDIRILGYSLPDSDSYIKYLLKSAIIESFNLKNIEIICLDPKGDIEKKYSEFVKFQNFNFFNANVLEYLEAIYQAFCGKYQSSGHKVAELTSIERGHKKFLEFVKKR